ncbi:DUF7619 domain-containing protein [Flavobacterium magnum]|nr:T9SS type A sorting domain-containing protein [Flavobacterium magnum]
MKNTMYLLLLTALSANAQLVNVPNVVFKNKLLSSSVNNSVARDSNGNNMKIDANSDGNIQVSEAEAVYQLDLSNASLSNVQGLESFVNLRRLVIYYNNLTGTLDVSMLTHLKVFYCDQNDITSLNVSGLTEMTNLWCSGNLLTTLDVTSLSALIELRAHENNLTAVDLSGCPLLYEVNLGMNNMLTVDFSNNPALYYIYLDRNPNLLSVDISGHTALWEIDIEGKSNQINALTTLNASGCTALVNLRAEYNSLTSLDVSGCTSLQALYITNSQLTTLDVSDCASLTGIIATNNHFETLFLKNGSNESALSFFMDVDDPDFIFNPAIDFICADEGQIASIQAMLNNYGMTNTVVNSYCSFTPGGNYNKITGSLHLDGDADGCDAEDQQFPFIKVKIDDGVSQSATYTLTDGSYKLYTQAGNFTVTPEVENPTFFTVSPANAAVGFPDNNNQSATRDFCITANGIHPDLEIVMAPITPARPGFEAVYEIVYKNKGNQVMSQANGISLQFQDSVLDFVSASQGPSAQAANMLYWDLLNLAPFESRTLLVQFTVNAPTDTPAVNISDLLQFTAAIEPLGLDETASDNTFSYTQTVVGSFDPNNITCLEGSEVFPDSIGNYLHYVVNFENTGTYPAEHIVVKMQIAPEEFDIGSLSVTGTSHPAYLRRKGNIVEVIFEDIQLAAGAHGNITFKLKISGNLVAGNTVSAVADIFFDYNAPITTNTAVTAISSLSVDDSDYDAGITIYPNPTTGRVYIQATSDIVDVEWFDAKGRLLSSSRDRGASSVRDVSHYAAGLYYVRVTSAKGSKIQKMVKN